MALEAYTYYISEDGEPERQVTLLEYVAAEHSAGFYAKGVGYGDPRYHTTPATGSFGREYGGEEIRGHSVYDPHSAALIKDLDVSARDYQARLSRIFVNTNLDLGLSIELVSEQWRREICTIENNLTPHLNATF